MQQQTQWVRGLPPRTISRVALLLATAGGALAGVWVLASRELADFLGEGPVRALGAEGETRQTIIGLGLLLTTAVAFAIAARGHASSRYAIGVTALVVATLLAPPLMPPVLALYAVALGAEWWGRASASARSGLAPRRHPGMWAAGGAAAIAATVVAVGVSWWLARPLFDEGKTLNEELGFAVASAATVTAPPAAATAMPAGVMGSVLAEGQLRGEDSFHFGSGLVRLLRAPDGKVVLRFEGHEVRNGPDLFVYLTPDPRGDVKAAGAVNLGGIKATRGNVNYEVPPNVDASKFRSVVIWCRAFDVTFAVARFE